MHFCTCNLLISIWFIADLDFSRLVWCFSSASVPQLHWADTTLTTLVNCRLLLKVGQNNVQYAWKESYLCTLGPGQILKTPLPCITERPLLTHQCKPNTRELIVLFTKYIFMFQRLGCRCKSWTLFQALVHRWLWSWYLPFQKKTHFMKKKDCG